LNHASRFRIFPFAASAIRQLNEAGFAVVVVTNQSGVARGYFPESLVTEVHEIMRRELAGQQARVDAIYYCAHATPDECECRKPKPGLLHRAAKELGLDLKRSYVVGDRYGDIELAHAAGARGILVRTGYGMGDFTWHSKSWPRQPDEVVEDLSAAVQWILGQTQ
jgi:D-glycero-D-manno-heptose 1,7-bisphosphate phosphatase